MRTPFIFLLLAFLLAAPGVALAADVPAPDPPKQVDVDIDIDRGDSVAWYKNPIVIGIGVIAVLLIAILASRGGGTTIVERH